MVLCHGELVPDRRLFSLRIFVRHFFFVSPSQIKSKLGRLALGRSWPTLATVKVRIRQVPSRRAHFIPRFGFIFGSVTLQSRKGGATRQHPTQPIPFSLMTT